LLQNGSHIAIPRTQPAATTPMGEYHNPHGLIRYGQNTFKAY
jgi:hypothetical protein